MTDFDGMTHDHIYDVVKAGSPGTMRAAATTLSSLSTLIGTHLDNLDDLSKSVATAWPDANGDGFRLALSHTITYLRDLQSSHVVTASASLTQVMSATQEKLSSTQTGMPTPPVPPVAAQRTQFNQHLKANNDAMDMGLAQASAKINQGEIADAKAVAMANALASLYATEAAKLTAPPPAPAGPHGSGTGTGSSTGSHSSSGSTGSMTYAPGTGAGGGGGGYASGAPVGVGSFNPGSGHGQGSTVGHGGGSGGSSGGGGTPVHGWSPVTGGGGTGGSGGGGGVGGPGVGGLGGAGLLDPTGSSGRDVGGAGFGPTGYSGVGDGGSVSGLLDGGGGLGLVGLTALGGAGLIAARKAAALKAAEQAALLRQETESEAEELALTQGGGGLTASQIAAMNAQRNGLLTYGEQSNLLNSERTYMTMQQRGLSAAGLTAAEEAELAASQRTVPGQLGETAAAAGASARGRVPFTPGGVVGGSAERVTWLVEDRDLWSADPGVRAIIED